MAEHLWLRRTVVSVMTVLLSTFVWLLFNAYVWRAPTVGWALCGGLTVWLSARAAEWLVRR